MKHGTSMAEKILVYFVNIYSYTFWLRKLAEINNKMASVASVIFNLIAILLISSHIQTRKVIRSAITSSPEIWLSTLSEIDSFEEIPAEAEFRTRSQFESDFVLKNGTDYVVFDDTDYAVFTCQSQYSVEWSVPHIEQVEGVDFYSFQTSASRVSQFYPNSVKPTNKYFETNLTVRFSYLNFLNVNFTCTATPSAIEEYHGIFTEMLPRSSSIHLFYAGQQAIERIGQTIKVCVPPSKDKDLSGEDTIILPCRPATPNVTIQLQKQVENRNTVNALNTNVTNTWIKLASPMKYVDFDPKVGFILKKDPVGQKNVFGFYKCAAVEDGGDEDDTSIREVGNQIVYINVTTICPDNKSWMEIGFDTVLKLKSNGSVIYNKQSFGNYPMNLSFFDVDELICCSGDPNNPPMTFSNICHGKLQCQIVQRIMEQRINLGQFHNRHKWSYNGRNDCQRHSLNDGLIVVCNGKDIEFAGTFIQVFADGLMHVANRSWRTPLTKFETEVFAKKAAFSNKILFIVGYPITSDELSVNNHYDRYRGKVFSLTANHDIVDDMNTVLENSQPDPEHQYYEFDDTLDLDRRFRCQESLSDTIAEYPRDSVYYEMEPLVLVCVGWKLLYSKGAHLAITWKNGTVTQVEEAGNNGKHFKTLYLSGGVEGYHLSDSSIEYRFGREVLAHKDMVSVDCWMPQLNTNEWDKLVKNLTILPGSLPQFVEGEGNITEQVVYFYLGEDEGKQLECQVVGGAPEPKLDVTKDGKGIFDRYQSYRYRPWFLHYESENFTRMINVTLQSKDTAHRNGTTATVDDGVAIIIIQFGKVTHEMQGVYQCSAGNIRGTVTRTFRVIVIERHRILLPILLTIIIISCLLLIGVGIRRLRLQHNIRSLPQNGTQ